MNKFKILQSENEYINFTINNYTNCYEDLNEVSIQVIIDLFKSFKNNSFSISNYLVDKKPLQGVKLTSREKREEYRKIDDLVNTLTLLSTSINGSDKKEVLFHQSLTYLCDSIKYLNIPELIDLNTLFENIHNHKQSLNKPLIEDGQIFYPFDRYPGVKKNIK